MKTGILTLYPSRNYGAVLQAYALQTVVERLGHTTQVLDFVSGTSLQRALLGTWSTPKGLLLKRFVKHCSAMIRYRQLARRNQRFNTFCQEYIHATLKRYHSSQELKAVAADYEALICGSDQVWRPTRNSDHTQAYFLVFADSSATRKISYAPSFGVSSVSESFQHLIDSWINDFSFLSVREETGYAIIEKATGRHAQVVLDPTLLLTSSDWMSISAKVSVEGPYILVYSTSQRGIFSELVRHVKKRTNLPVIALSLYGVNLVPAADKVIYDAGPQEFIRLFSGASCICTNSFHGTAFSLIHRRPFWGVPHNMANSRIADLLTRIGLRDRQVQSLEEFPEAPLEIDYSNSEPRLQQEKDASLAFLEAALQSR